MISRDLIDIHGYVGPNGSGKTWLALNHPCKLPCQIRIRINWADPSLAQGARVISEAKELLSVLREWKAAGQPKGLLICWDGAKKYGHLKGWEIVAKLALQFGMIELIADEAHRYCTRNLSNQPWLDEILSRGFHFGVSFKWTSTAPKQMCPEFRTQSRRIAVFYAPDTTFKGFAVDMGAKDIWDDLRRAGDYSYILFFRKLDPKLMKPYKVKSS